MYCSSFIYGLVLVSGASLFSATAMADEPARPSIGDAEKPFSISSLDIEDSGRYVASQTRSEPPYLPRQRLMNAGDPSKIGIRRVPQLEDSDFSLVSLGIALGLEATQVARGESGPLPDPSASHP